MAAARLHMLLEAIQRLKQDERHRNVEQQVGGKIQGDEGRRKFQQRVLEAHQKGAVNEDQNPRQNESRQ